MAHSDIASSHTHKLTYHVLRRMYCFQESLPDSRPPPVSFSPPAQPVPPSAVPVVRHSHTSPLRCARQLPPPPSQASCLTSPHYTVLHCIISIHTTSISRTERAADLCAARTHVHVHDATVRSTGTVRTGKKVTGTTTAHHQQPFTSLANDVTLTRRRHWSPTTSAATYTRAGRAHAQPRCLPMPPHHCSPHPLEHLLHVSREQRR